ncbi:phosphatidate cytidylyltransferase [Desulfococcaceae bacterium HSG8]|nr:phosphatidate cytidylyltransferase [Desulfococcaceae bacterium HSG8]
MHLKRWITGLSALPFLIFPIYKGEIYFIILLSIACLLALCEYFRIAFNPKSKTISGIIIIAALLTGQLMILSAHRDPHLITALIALNLIISGLFSLTQFKNDPFILENIAKQVQGVVYIPLPLSFLVIIRNGPDGMAWIFFLLCIVFAGDIGAFYAGSYLGRHKLCPSVSPGKTVEGSVGGLAANIIVGALFKAIFLPALPWGISILLFLLIGAAGQVGDLFESEFKRSSGIKDSGSILPGHGGILDRIDALLFAIPVAYIFKVHIL